MVRILTILLALSLAVSCQKPKSALQTEDSGNDTITCIAQPPLPIMLQSQAERMHYLAVHYWDEVNLADTNYLHHTDLLETRWNRYVQLLYQNADTSVCHQSLNRLITRMASNPSLALYFLNQAEQTWYDPNATCRSMRNYQWVVEAFTSMNLSGDEFAHFQAQLPMLLRNSEGSVAADFSFTDRKGRTGSLYSLKSPFLLLYLNNPDCDACQTLRQQLAQVPELLQWQKKGQVTILSVYTDAQEEMWEKCCREYPNEWIVVRDREQMIATRGLYDLRAIPSLYLLDADKHVLLRDASLQEILAHLSKVLE